MMRFWLDPEAFPGTTTATPPVQKPKNILLCNKSFFENKQNIFSQPYFLLSKIFWVVKLESSPMVKKKVRCIFEIPVFDRLLLVLYSSGKSPLSTS